MALKHSGRNKEVRIRGIIPRYASGGIFHIEGECRDLETELLVFPKGAHDDVVDSLAYQNDIAEIPVSDVRKSLIRRERSERSERIAKNYGL